MSSFTRRDFIKSASMLALLAGSATFFEPMRLARAAAPTAKKEFLLICDTPNLVIHDHFAVLNTNPGSINVLEVAANEAFKIDVPFLGHTVTQNPAKPHHVVSFEKWGKRGALADLQGRMVIASADVDDGYVFFGHAAYVSESAALLTTEDNYARSEGQIAVRDPETLKFIQKMPSYGAGPHDCRAIDNGRTLMVMNGSSVEKAPNLAWIEAASGKLLHKIDLGIEPTSTFAHFDMAENGWIAAVGFLKTTQPGNGRIALISPDGRVLTPHLPEAVAARLDGEVLSVAFLGDSDLVAATVPKANVVVVINYKTQEFAALVEIHHPTGVLSGLGEPATMIVNRGKYDRDLMKVALSGGKPLITPEAAKFGGNSSHLTRIYI